MADLYFKVQADYDKVIRLREEIRNLEAQLKSVSKSTPTEQIAAMEQRLSGAKQEFNQLAHSAAVAGANLGTKYKGGITSLNNTINDLSVKILNQKEIIRDVEADVRRLNEAYKSASKGNKSDIGAKRSEYLAAKKALEEEKAALFALSQEQSRARVELKKLNNEYKNLQENSEENADIFGELRDKLASTAAVIAGGIGVKEFVGKMIQVRGEFQQMETALQTMLGSKEKADELLANVKEYAKISPLELSSVAGATKMMLGFNIEAEKIPRYLQAIGDVSMGDAQKFNSLTLAFSQMSAAGKLMGQDLLQMVNAGFNPLSVISEQTGKSIGQLREEMSKGAISAEMIQKAFIDATSEGGKFYKMSENASKTINGQLSMMQDAMDAAFNEMGQASEGLIIKSIQTATSLVENYQSLGKIIAGVAATYGVYRAAVLATIAVEKIQAASRLAAITHTNMLSVATGALTKKLGLLNIVANANPYVLLATAVAGVAAAMWAFHDSSTEAEKAQKRLTKRREEDAKAADEQAKKMDSLIGKSRDLALSDMERGESLAELRKEYPKIFEKYDLETIKLADILDLKRQIAAEDANRKAVDEKEYLNKLNRDIAALEFKLSTQKTDFSGSDRADLARLKADRDAVLMEKGKSISGVFISNMNKVDMSEIDRYVSVLENKIKGKSGDDTLSIKLPIDIEGNLSEAAVYSVADIKKLIEIAKTTKKNRTEAEKNKTTYKQDLEKAKKEWEEAKKELNKIEKDKDKFTTKQYEEAKNREKTTNEAYSKLGGKTNKQIIEEKKEEGIDEQEEVAKKFLAEKRQKEQNEKLLSQYQGYLEKRKAIALKYDVDRVNLIFGGASDEAIAENEYQKQRALEAIDNEFAQREDEFNAWANRIINLSVDKLEELLNIAEEELEKLEGTDPDNENLSVARAKVTALRNQIKKEKEKADKDSEEETEKVTTDWKELYKVLTSVKQEFSEIGDIVGGTAGAVLSLAGETGVFITSTISSIETLSNAAAEGISKVEQASIILSIISGAMKILTEISNLIGDKFSQYQAYAAKIDEINQLRDAVNDYKMAVIEARHAEENWFAEDNLKNLRDYKEIQQQALQNYKLKLEETQAIYQNEGGGGWLTDLWKPIAEMIDAAYGKIYGFEINEDYKKGTTEARNNLRIETRKASKGFLGTGIGGKSQKTEDLVQWARNNGFGELFDENDMINEEAAKQILEKHGNKLVGQTKATLEALLEYKEQYDAYLEELRNYVSSLYEPLVDNMVDSLWDWLDEGKNALDSFKEYASDTFRDIVSDMMRTIILEKVVGSFSTDIADIYEKYATGKMTEDELAREVANRTQGLVDDYETNMPVLQEILSNIKEYLAAAGIDLNATSTTSQEASGKGFQTMSQDTGDELNGRFTALQLAGEEIKNQTILQTQSMNILTMKADNMIAIMTNTNYIADDIRTQIANSYLEIVGIRENTSAIVKPIIQMQKDIAEVKENTKNL